MCTPVRNNLSLLPRNPAAATSDCAGATAGASSHLPSQSSVPCRESEKLYDEEDEWDKKEARKMIAENTARLAIINGSVKLTGSWKIKHLQTEVLR